MTSLLADVVTREPLAAADGRSGSLLERVILANGRTLVVKHVLDGGDWIMRGCHDHGRAAELWAQGVLARVPAVIDHAVVGAEQVEGGWVVVMRDVSAAWSPTTPASPATTAAGSWRRPPPSTPPSRTTRRWPCARWPTATSSCPRPRPGARPAEPTRCRG